MAQTNSAFISYRREAGYLWALAVYQKLESNRIDAFLDLEELNDAGYFDTRILNQIAARPYFLVVLTPGTLDRCPQPDDWLRRELMHAISTGRTVIPLFTPGFDEADIGRFLDATAGEELSRSQGVKFSPDVFAECAQRLMGMLKPVAADADAVAPEDAALAEAVAARTDKSPEVTLEELRKQEAEWAPPTEQDVESVPDAEPDAPSRPTSPTNTTAGRYGRVAAIAAAVLILVAAVVGVVVALSGDGDGGAEPTTPPTEPGQRDRLEVNQQLRPGEWIESADGRHRLEMTHEGELVGTTGGVEFFRRPDDGPPGAVAIMQNDGNFVVYQDAQLDRDIFATRTTGNPGAFVTVEDVGGEGSVVVYSSSGGELWRRPEDPGAEPAEPDAPTTDATTTSSSSTTTTPTTTTPPTIFP